jgi:hypothetical protein
MRGARACVEIGDFRPETPSKQEFSALSLRFSWIFRLAPFAKPIESSQKMASARNRLGFPMVLAAPAKTPALAGVSDTR